MTRPRPSSLGDTAATIGDFTAQEIAAWAGFLRTHSQVVRHLDADLQASHGIPLTQFDVLLQLRLHGGRLRMRELATALMLSRSGLSRLVDHLEGRGWVERQPDPTDARGLYAALTRSGRAALRKAQTAHIANVRRRFLDALHADQLRVLAESWEAVGHVTSDPREPASRNARPPVHP